MFGTKKKQRSALPEKQQLTKYYEMDGALRAYANRMALLGMTCGVFALGTLALFAYVGSAILVKPDLRDVIAGTLIPTIRFSRDFLSIIVAIVGTTLSAYLFTWQSNVEVEEEIAKGRVKLSQRRGATRGELRQSRRDIAIVRLVVPDAVLEIDYVAVSHAFVIPSTKRISWKKLPFYHLK